MPKSVYIKTYKTQLVNQYSGQFDGTNDYISLPNLGFSGNVDISVEAWIYVTDLSSSRCIFSFSTEGTTRAGFGFSVNGTPNAGLIQLFNWADDCNSAVGVIQVNTWYHVACTYEATTRIRKVYVNGSIVAQSTAGANLNLTDASYSIGKRVSNTDYFRGYIQDVRIWNVVRTQSEITQNLGRIISLTTTGLVANYRLNEGSGTTAIDRKNGYNGTLTNGATYSPIYIAPVYETIYKGINDYEFKSITSNINNGFESVTFSIPKKFDDFGYENPSAPALDTNQQKVGLNGYSCKIVVYDKENPRGVTIFNGEMAKVSRGLSNQEDVTIICVGPIFRLEKTYLEIAGNRNVTFTSLDQAEIMRRIIDSYNGQNPLNPIYYTGTSLPNTGITATLNFNNATCLDAITTAFKQTDYNKIWLLDVDSTFYLKDISTFPDPQDHFFVMGKDIISLKIDEDILNMVNDIAIWDGGSIAKRFVSPFSIQMYGRLAGDNIRDSRLSSIGIDNLGTRIISTQAFPPNQQVEIEVLDSEAGGYDLKSIKVGDTCKILNINANSGLSKIMVITKKVDYLDKAKLTISDVSAYTSRELYDLKKQQQQVNYESGPATYTITSL
jgi:hypothetical protein